MARIVGLDNGFMSVCCQPEAGIVHHVVHRFVISAVFRQGLQAGLALMEAHGATKWLSDDRRNGPLSVADSDWATHQWRPRALRAGWAHWAIVMPESVLGQMKTRRLAGDAAANGLCVRTFEDPAAALRWLESPKQT